MKFCKAIGPLMSLTVLITSSIRAELAVDFDHSQISSGVQQEYYSFPLDTHTPAWVSSAPNARPKIYTGLFLDPVNGWTTGVDDGGAYTNGAAVSFGNSGGAKLQLNGPWLGSGTGTVPGVEDGRYAAGDVFTGIFLFQQDDFLNGLDAGPVKMNPGFDQLSADLIYQPSGLLASGTYRWVIQDAGQFFISETVTNLTSAGNLAVSLEAKAASLAWRNYDPVGDGTLATVSTIANGIGSPASPTLQSIEAVGFWLQVTVATNTGFRLYPRLGVEAFQASAVSDDASSSGACVIDTGIRHQKMEGFGASGAYFQNRLVTHNQSSELAELLFDDLGLDIFRIRNVYLQSGYANDVQTFRDTIQLGEAASGRPLKILLSSWTPPAELKSTGSEAGSNDATLASDANGYRYDDFATWWADSLDYYHSNGIDPEYISIQNEPNWHPDYDGCGFEPTETTNFAGYNQAFEAVWLELAERHGTMSMPKMIGPEPIGINRLDEYIDALINRDHMYGYAHHLYQSNPAQNPDVLNSQMSATQAAYGYKPLFQTEYAYLNGNTNSLIDRKLDLAKLMYNALTLEKVSAYFYWGLYWDSEDEQGLINIPNNANAPYSINTEYYAFKHYSAFVHADWRRVEADPGTNALSISAFTSPERDATSVIIVNEGMQAINLNLNFTNTAVLSGAVYQSTETLDCAFTGNYTPGSAVLIPAQSITTLALTNMPVAVPDEVNILMIAIDDLRPQLRCYGVPQMKTPNIDRLSADGYQFNRAYVQQGVCGPSRASLMTGLRPDTTLAYDFDSNFRDTAPWAYTLPQVLSQNGFHSVGIGKIFHVINEENDPLSWDETWMKGGGTYGSTGNVPYESTTGPESALRDGAVTDSAVAKLAQLKSQQPFFYGVGYVRPHLPFVAPSEYWDLYSVSDLDLPYTDSPAVDASAYAYTTWGELRNYSGIPASGPVSAVQEQNLIHGYYACVSFVDAQVGRLIQALEEQGLAENTIVVVWGDHGWHLGDHGQWCKHTNFERATRIPLIVKVPWLPGADKVDALVEALDIYPTLLDLCGIEVPEFIQGESMLPWLENPDLAGPTEAVSQYPRNSQSIMGYSMRTDRYRYVEWRAAGSDVPADIELYDHFLDPGEDTNVVSAADPALLAELSARLDPYIGSAYRSADGFGNQLVNNGEFDNGLTGWAENEGGGASANFNALTSDGSNGLGDDPLVHIDPVIPGSGLWQIALEQITGIDAAKTYTIRFSARAESVRNMKVLWKNKNNNPNDAYFDSGNFSVGTAAQTYQFSAIVPANLSGTDPDAELRLQLGGNSADVWIDSVEVFEELEGIATESFADVLLDAGLSGADALAYADADGDGVHNVFEYAFNMDLTTNDYHLLVPGAGTSGLPTHQMANTNSFQALELQYLRRRGAVDLEYIPEFIGTLSSNDWNAGSGETAAVIDSEWERVTARDSETTETATNRFGRVRVNFVP